MRKICSVLPYHYCALVSPRRTKNVAFMVRTIISSRTAKSVLFLSCLIYTQVPVGVMGYIPGNNPQAVFIVFLYVLLYLLKSAHLCQKYC